MKRVLLGVSVLVLSLSAGLRDGCAALSEESFHRLLGSKIEHFQQSLKMSEENLKDAQRLGDQSKIKSAEERIKFLKDAIQSDQHYLATPSSSRTFQEQGIQTDHPKPRGSEELLEREQKSHISDLQARQKVLIEEKKKLPRKLSEQEKKLQNLAKDISTLNVMLSQHDHTQKDQPKNIKAIEDIKNEIKKTQEEAKKFEHKIKETKKHIADVDADLGDIENRLQNMRRA